jgi:hypothetical protein
MLSFILASQRDEDFLEMFLESGDFHSKGRDFWLLYWIQWLDLIDGYIPRVESVRAVIMAKTGVRNEQIS